MERRFASTCKKKTLSFPNKVAVRKKKICINNDGWRTCCVLFIYMYVYILAKLQNTTRNGRKMVRTSWQKVFHDKQSPMIDWLKIITGHVDN